MPLSPVADKLPVALRGRLGLALVGVIGLSATLSIVFLLREADSQGGRKEFERRADLHYELLRASLREYDSALFALRLLVENSDELSPAEFQQAARRIARRIPGVQAVQWAPLIRHDDLPAFTVAAREHVAPDFTPRALQSDGTLAPISAAPSDAEHAIISYIEPLEGNDAAIGYDVYTAPTASTLRRARAIPETSAVSAVFPLIQGGQGIAFCLFVPRPASDTRPSPVGGDGFLQLILRLDAASVRFFQVGLRPIHDTLVLDVTDEAPTPIYLRNANHTEPELLPATAPADFLTHGTIIRDLPVGGRLWRIYFRPSTEWITSRRSLAPLFTLIGGSLSTLLAIAFLNTLRRQTASIRRQVALRTAELNESRALLDAITDNNPSSIWVKDTSLRYQLVNARFARLHDLNRSEIVGRTEADLHPPEIAREREADDTEVLTTGQTRHFEHASDLGGRRRVFLVTKFPLLRADGSIYALAGIATDITALREAEARQLAIERNLLETQKLESLGVLAGGVAHDFNNLLTSILGHANLLRLQLPANAGAQASLRQIEKASQRAAELCRQMLAYSGRGRFALQPLELGQLVRDSTALLELSLARRARLHFDLSSDLPPIVADPTQIRQIVMNLVTNASESLVDGCGDITLRTQLVHASPELFSGCVITPDSPGGDYVRLEVIDTGAGMPAHVLSRIFDPFFTTKFTGRGLGLAAVLGIVRGHHGGLHVESTVGQGTIFRLYFPVSPTPPAPAPAPEPVAAPPEPAPAVPSQLRLLLVDDENAVRETAADLLKASGYAVDSCADGETALRLFTQAPETYHAAILDLTMPGLGGGALMERLREIRPGLPVLIISGYDAHDSAVLNLLATPGVDFLAKPFTLSALREKLQRLLQTTGSAA
jgi:PAS domain S-box